MSDKHATLPWDQTDDGGDPDKSDVGIIVVKSRRQVLTDRRLKANAKLLFVFLLDFSYLRIYGGGEPGVITISIAQISQLLKLRPRAIIKAKKELNARHYIWWKNKFLPNAKPMHVYHITALKPEPADWIQTMLDGRWGTSDASVVQNGNGNFSAQNGEGNSQVPHLHTGNGQNGQLAMVEKDNGPLSKTSTASTQKGQLPVVEKDNWQYSKTSTANGRKGQLAVAQNGNGHVPKTALLKESPDSNGVSGVKGSGPLTLPLPKFEALDDKMFARARRIEGEKQIEYFKEKIFGLENSRKPATNQTDVIAAYKQRIREVKKWMAGEK